MAFGQPRIEYKTNAQMRIMHEAGLVLSRALDAAQAAAAPGVTTKQLDEAFAAVLNEAGAKSNFLGYHGFPSTICTSVNEEVVHGIPGGKVLNDGDIISIDGGAIVNGWHSDSARTVIVGKADPEDQRLSDVTQAAMWRGIAA
ncbi:M24 family metallopeptidase, partial [Arthrobacter sp. HMWF013]|uniref:M24 family metallopeptidase n=1 Tax=Arthrobacter sp. HMWF013 TaxID=2056849 RepID=UPI002159E5A6